MGARVAVFTTSLDSIAMMPCNPSVGGPGKGHLVREIDALGGEMGRCTDGSALQMRRLNTGKGVAVQSLRAQVDRQRYHWHMRQTLEQQEGLYLIEAIVADLVLEGQRISGVTTKLGRRYGAKAVVLAPGPYLAGRIHVGAEHYAAGPRGQRAVEELARSLHQLDLRMMRFKTGTPPRIHRRSIDFSKMERLDGDAVTSGFSFDQSALWQRQEPCWITYTNLRTHQIIQDNLDRSAMYGGAITGPGPRYCPSIESKIVMFPHRERHQVFIEPEGLNTQEMYLAGMSTSMPEDVQVEMVRSVAGLERAELTRCGYAIEYDCLDSLQLTHALQVKTIDGLFTAGQLNGTTGYEEAAAQGLIAGINAVKYIRGEEPFVLARSQAYIGVLIDDLVTKGTGEPYRVMTSRAEYRLLLRDDTADRRLCAFGRELGLVSQAAFERFEAKRVAIEKETQRLQQVMITPGEASDAVLQQMGSTPLVTGSSLADLLRRPEVTYAGLAAIDVNRPELPDEIITAVETDLRYSGYVERERRHVQAQQRMENRHIPVPLDYNVIKGLSREAQDKLMRVQPTSIGQAGRIPGVSPADIAIVMVHLEAMRRKSIFSQ
jgi:tRNA uridine 5-carboxymethylaminomethyl modification enzyme